MTHKKIRKKSLKPERRAAHFLDVVSELICVPPNAKILDFGCGNGDLVFELRKMNQAFGCDFKFKEGNNVKYLENKDIIRLIEPPYRLPYEDNFFDIIFSDNVLEHVMNYQPTFSEIYRVLRPSGVCLHFFSSRYRFFEVHKRVPLGSIIKKKGWFSLWAYLGIKSSHQKNINMKITDIIDDNYNYLNNNTNYLRKDELQNVAFRYFDEVKFVENYFLKHSDRGKYIYPICLFFPFVASLYSTLRTRVMYCKKIA